MPCCGATEAVWCGQGRGQTFGAQTFGPLGAELSGRDARTSGSSASRHPPPLEAPSARTQRPRGCGCRLPLRERVEKVLNGESPDAKTQAAALRVWCMLQEGKLS